MCISIAPQTNVFKWFLSTRIYEEIALISHWSDFSLIPLGKYVWRRATNRCKNIKFYFILLFFFLWESPLYEIWEYAFKLVPATYYIHIHLIFS